MLREDAVKEFRKSFLIRENDNRQNNDMNVHFPSTVKPLNV